MDELLRKLLALPPQASSVAADIDRLHFVVISVTMLGATLVAAVALWFVVKYRARKPDEVALGEPATVREGPLQWAMSGAVLVLFLAFWFVGVRQYIGLHAAPREFFRVG